MWGSGADVTAMMLEPAPAGVIRHVSAVHAVDGETERSEHTSEELAFFKERVASDASFPMS